MLNYDSDNKCRTYDNMNGRSSLIVEQMLVFFGSTNVVREVKTWLQISNKLDHNVLYY